MSPLPYPTSLSFSPLFFQSILLLLIFPLPYPTSLPFSSPLFLPVLPLLIFTLPYPTSLAFSSPSLPIHPAPSYLPSALSSRVLPSSPFRISGGEKRITVTTAENVLVQGGVREGHILRLGRSSGRLGGVLARGGSVCGLVPPRLWILWDFP